MALSSSKAIILNFFPITTTVRHWPAQALQVKSKENRKNHSIFVTGEAYRLQLEGPLFTGGLPTLSMGSAGGGTSLLRHPPPILWSAVLKKGFVGCLKDVVINGKDIDVAKIAEKQDSGEWVSEREKKEIYFSKTFLLRRRQPSFPSFFPFSPPVRLSVNLTNMSFSPIFKPEFFFLHFHFISLFYFPQHAPHNTRTEWAEKIWPDSLSDSREERVDLPARPCIYNVAILVGTCLLTFLPWALTFSKSLSLYFICIIHHPKGYYPTLRALRLQFFQTLFLIQSGAIRAALASFRLLAI